MWHVPLTMDWERLDGSLVTAYPGPDGPRPEWARKLLAEQLVEPGRRPLWTPPHHLPVWWLAGPRPRRRTPERRLSSVEAGRGGVRMLPR